MVGWAGYGYCASHSRFFWGLRLFLSAPRRACRLPGRSRTRRSTRGRCSPRCSTASRTWVADRPGLLVIADKGFAYKEFETDLAFRGIEFFRPSFKRERRRKGQSLLKSV